MIGQPLDRIGSPSRRIRVAAPILHREPLPVEKGPPELGKLLARCLRKDPARRIAHMGDVRLALEELKEESNSGREKAPGPLPRRFPIGAVALAAVVLLLLAASVWWFAIRRSDPIDPLAVLPFVNASGDPNTEYLSEGIRESLITSLSRVPRLKVKSRDTVFR